MSSSLQHGKPIARERNVIDFGGYFIYGGHFMNRRIINVRHQTCNSEEEEETYF